MPKYIFSKLKNEGSGKTNHLKTLSENLSPPSNTQQAHTSLPKLPENVASNVEIVWSVHINNEFCKTDVTHIPPFLAKPLER